MKKRNKTWTPSLSTYSLVWSLKVTSPQWKPTTLYCWWVVLQKRATWWQRSAWGCCSQTVSTWTTIALGQSTTFPSRHNHTHSSWYSLYFNSGQILHRPPWPEERILHIFSHQIPITLYHRRHKLLHQRFIHPLDRELANSQHEPQLMEHKNRQLEQALPATGQGKDRAWDLHVFPEGVLLHRQQEQAEVLHLGAIVRGRPICSELAPLILEEEDNQGVCRHQVEQSDELLRVQDEPQARRLPTEHNLQRLPLETARALISLPARPALPHPLLRLQVARPRLHQGPVQGAPIVQACYEFTDLRETSFLFWGGQAEPWGDWLLWWVVWVRVCGWFVDVYFCVECGGVCVVL